MFIGFLDNTEIYVGDNRADNRPDIYVFGGYFVEHKRIEELQGRIAEIKTEYGLEAHYPVKWNLRDNTLKDFYQKQGLDDIYEHLMDSSDSIRRSMLKLISGFDAVVMACGLYRLYKDTEQRDCYRWAFENLLQRIGLMAQSRDTKRYPNASLMIVVDWPQTEVSKCLFDIYYSGYHMGKAVDSGQSYYSGPLSSHRFADFLCHSSTLHSGPLQLADLVAGCIKDFLSWCYTGEGKQRAQRFFKLLAWNIYRGPNGKITGYGLKVSQRGFAPLDLDAKIEELLREDNGEVAAWI